MLCVVCPLIFTFYIFIVAAHEPYVKTSFTTLCIQFMFIYDFYVQVASTKYMVIDFFVADAAMTLVFEKPEFDCALFSFNFCRRMRNSTSFFIQVLYSSENLSKVPFKYNGYSGKLCAELCFIVISDRMNCNFILFHSSFAQTNGPLNSFRPIQRPVKCVDRNYHTQIK